MIEVLKLSTPVMIDGKEAGELSYDFESMTARERLGVSGDMTTCGISRTTVEEYDTEYHFFLFAKAVEVATKGKIAVADVLRISAKDSQKAGSLARNFFYMEE